MPPWPMPPWPMPQRQTAALVLVASHFDHSCRFPFTCPTVTLMFIDDPHRLHERITNSRSNEAEAPLFQVLAHRVALRGRLSDVPQMQRPATQHLTVRELPDVLVEGLQ